MIKQLKGTASMKRYLICAFVLTAVILYAAVTFAAPTTSDVEKRLRADFPDLPFSSISLSPVAGLYEIAAGQDIYYYALDDGILVVGQMYNKSKQNITAARMQELAAKYDQERVQKSKDLPLDKAVKTGSGKNTVIEFTDPDCPFCRKAAEFFAKRTDVTKYTFFAPLPMHPDAGNKVRYILCQKDRGKAFEEVMNGKLDKDKYETCKDAGVDELVKSHEAVVAKMGISGTPLFIVNGAAAIYGADIPQLARLLGKDAMESK